MGNLPPETAARFTAVGFYFARRIQKDVNVPIGLIDDNWGGTRIEPWIPPVGFQMVPELASIWSDVEQKTQPYPDGLAKTLPELDRWVATTRKRCRHSERPADGHAVAT